MFEGISEERLLHLTSPEVRLLANAKQAYDDFAREFIAGNHPHALRALLNGFNAAANLYDSLLGNSRSRNQDKAKYAQLFNSDTPNNPPISLLDRRLNRVRDFTFAELVYAVRCAFDHSYEDLDAHRTGLDSEVHLRWDFRAYWQHEPWVVFTCDHILIDAYDLMQKLSLVLAKCIFCIEAAQKMYGWKQNTFSGPIKSSHPTFSKLLEEAGLVTTRLLSPEEVRRFQEQMRGG